MTSAFFTYDKPKVVQALRYHFITRSEIKLMMILVNVFAVVSAALFFFKKVSPPAFLISSFLWMVLMLVFWFIMPRFVYRRTLTFKDSFKATFDGNGYTMENDRGSRTWPWSELSNWMESPHFFHLYFNPRSFLIVPKDAFAGDDVHAARKVLEENITKK
jgi:YcxB-like protein